MKKIITSLAIIVVFLSAKTVYSAGILQVFQGGTGATTLTGCLQGNGTGPITATGVPCGSGGGGGGGGTFSTTTPFGSTLLQYPYTNMVTSLNTSATSSSKWWYNPFINVQYLNGFLGIGTTTPTSALTIDGGSIKLAGSGTFGASIISNANNDLRVTGQNNAGGASVRLLPYLGDAYIEDTANGNIIFRTNSDSSATELARLTSTGNLGVGTSSPYRKASIAGDAVVDGNIRTSSITSTSTTATNAISGNITIDGTTRVATSITGPLQAISGAVTATSTLSTAYGGTGITTVPSYGQVLVGNSSGTYTPTATSSLGITGGGGSLSGGSTNTLTYWTSDTTVGATSSPTVGYITATTTTATSTFLGGLRYKTTNCRNGITLASTSDQGGTVICEPQNYWDDFNRYDTTGGTVSDAPTGHSYFLHAAGGSIAGTKIKNGELIVTDNWTTGGYAGIHAEVDVKEPVKKAGGVIRWLPTGNSCGTYGSVVLLISNKSATSTGSYPNEFLHFVFGVNTLNLEYTTSGVPGLTSVLYKTTDFFWPVTGENIPFDVHFTGNGGVSVLYGNRTYFATSTMFENLRGRYVDFEQYYGNTDTTCYESRYDNLYAGDDSVKDNTTSNLPGMIYNNGTTSLSFNVGLNGSNLKILDLKAPTTTLDVGNFVLGNAEGEKFFLGGVPNNGLPTNTFLSILGAGGASSNTVPDSRINFPTGANNDYGTYIASYYPTYSTVQASVISTLGTRYGGTDTNMLSISRVGVGVNTSLLTGFASSTFNVNGSSSFGADYVSKPGPANGVIIQGNTGIGTTSPYAKLSVAGQVVGEYFTATSTSATSTLPQLTGSLISGYGLTDCDDATNSKLLWSSTGVFSCGTDRSSAGGSGGGSWSTTTSTVSGRLVNYPNNNTDIVSIGSNSTTTSKYWFDPNMQISYLTGNVGIGTTTPSSALTISGDIKLAGSGTFGASTISNMNNDLRVTASSNGGGASIRLLPYLGDAYVEDTANGNIIFRTNTDSSALELARLTSTGRFGVGSSTPYGVVGIKGAGTGTGISFTIGNSADVERMTVLDNGTVKFVNSGLGQVTIGNQAAPTIQFGYNGSNTGRAFITGDGGSGTDLELSAGGTGGNSYLSNTSFKAGIFGGKFGIGTTSPYAALSVVGEIVGSHFTATSTTATSTFANGINITGGCFAVNGTCFTGGGGGGSSASTTALTDNNTFSGLNAFTNTGTTTFAGPIIDKTPRNLTLSIANTTTSDTRCVYRIPTNITISRVRVYQSGATNVVGQVAYCDGITGTPTTIDADITASASEATDDGSITTSNLNMGQYLGWKTTSVSGTNLYTTINIEYVQR